MSMNLKINRYDTKKEKRRRLSDVVYVVLTMAAFAAAGFFMFIFPRSHESALEKRDLAEFPEFTMESFVSGEYTKALGTYFSDTVPFRDTLMVISSAIRDMTGFRLNNIKLHNVVLAENPAEAPEESTETLSETSLTTASVRTDSESEETTTVTELPASAIDEEHGEYTPITTAESAAAVEMDDSVNITNNGIAVVGTRALMLYGGSLKVGESYAEVINKYKKQLGDVNVYCMVIPTSVEFYCPESVKKYTASQLDNINNIYSHLDGVTPVDVYSPLNLHSAEPVYLRTDHHWASLGAYYAAKQFAEAADVPFDDLTEYEEKRVSGYVGTMYSYTQDIVIQNNPEDFVWYVSKNAEITTTYQNYILGKNNAVIGIKKPVEANFFVDLSKNKPMMYCTFMGGDAKITHVKTSAGNGRRLAIFKDSYGNALPQFLFNSFEEIYVLDMRFFTYNAIDFLKEKGITDLLFANNAFHATTRSTVTHYETFLVQGNNATVTTKATTVPPQTSAPAVTTTTTTGTSAKKTSAPAKTTAPPETETSKAKTTAPPDEGTEDTETTTKKKKKPKKTTASTTEESEAAVTEVTTETTSEETQTSPREFFETAAAEREEEYTDSE